mmetsp:Transcript_10125/g.30526  ORF Transcript_10125/g.30526 Transcript_10125/m.30526 type:complete len:235 (-) Transcript_10125:6012-6716(-)
MQRGMITHGFKRALHRQHASPAPLGRTQLCERHGVAVHSSPFLAHHRHLHRIPRHHLRRTARQHRISGESAARQVCSGRMSHWRLPAATSIMANRCPLLKWRWTGFLELQRTRHSLTMSQSPPTNCRLKRVPTFFCLRRWTHTGVMIQSGSGACPTGALATSPQIVWLHCTMLFKMPPKTRGAKVMDPTTLWSRADHRPQRYKRLQFSTSQGYMRSSSPNSHRQNSRFIAKKRL